VAQIASKQKVAPYAFDEQSALKVADGRVEVILEGLWDLFD
jgi:hypothetical protein